VHAVVPPALVHFAGQAAHSVADALYLPAAHAWHTACPFTVTSAASHAVHAVAPLALIHPAGHASHASVAPFSNCPAAHAVHSDRATFVVDPAPQSLHAAFPAPGANVSAGQSPQDPSDPAFPGAHDVQPVWASLTFVPSSHTEHEAAPPRLYNPAPHGLHCSATAASAVAPSITSPKVPAGHTTHVV